MANIAQTINVLQAMILTDGPRMTVTPTYHVFEMFKSHRDSIYLPVQLTSECYEVAGKKVSALSVSASRKDGRITVSLVHTNPRSATTLTLELRGAKASAVTGRVLTGSTLHVHNTFDQPNVVQPAKFADAHLEGELLHLILPPASIVVLELTC